jgi:translation initiation factor eIF-2B subunit delta
MSEGLISGSTDRCLALMRVFKMVIADYHTPPGKSLDRDLNTHLSPAIRSHQCIANTK